MTNSYIVHKAVELAALSKKLQADIENHTYLLSPKYDGCHAVFLFDNGVFVGARSRTNEVVASMDHIGHELLELYPFLQWGKRAICGEAWMQHTEFSEISGIFRRQYPQPQLCFVPFDATYWRYNQVDDGWPVLGESMDPSSGHQFDGHTYNERLGKLHNTTGVPRRKVLPTGCVVLEQGDAIWATAVAEGKRLKQLGGYDGAVLARADGLYRVGAGKGGEFIKVKPLISHTCKCVGVERAKGEKTGKNTLALIIEFGDAFQKVSTGLTQAEADNPDQFLYKMIEVEAMGLTVNGLLREPRYRGIRTDVL